MIFLQLFLTFAWVGLIGFGGGYSASAIMYDLIVDGHGWLTAAEFRDVVTVSEMTPGPIGINMASFVGAKIAGIPGTLVSTLSYVFPATIIIIILAKLYLKYKSLPAVQRFLKGLQPGVCAMIFGAGVKLAKSGILGGSFDPAGYNWLLIAVAVLMLVLLRLKKIKPVPAILLSGAAGTVLMYIFQMI